MLPNEPFCYTDLQYLTVPLPTEIAALRENADFAGEVRRIDKLLPRVTDTVMHKRLLLERFIADGLSKDYRIGFDEMLSLLRQHHPYMTAAHLYAILDMGFADVVYRAGGVHFENDAEANILSQCDTYLRQIADPSYVPQPDYRITENHIADLQKYGKVQIRYTVREAIRANLVREGKTLRVWLPYPAVTPELSDIRTLSSSHPVRIDDHVLRCAYMELSDYHGETAEITLSFVNTARYREIAPELVDAVQPDMPEYLCEQLPHIQFSPYLRMLEAEITGHHKNPLIRARRIYDYITKNVRYSFMRQYRYFDNIPTYCAVNHRGDCGVQALLFITLARISGIPARWQSGNSVKPALSGKSGGHIGSHDWAQFYIAPFGWLQCDPSVGGGAYQCGKEAIWDFYFCHADAFRYICATAFQTDLSPAKTYMRLDPYDNQSGEAEYTDAYLDPDDVTCCKELLETEVSYGAREG